MEAFEGNPNIILKLKEIRKDIAVAVIHKDKEELDKMKDSFKDFQRVVYSFGVNVDEATVKHAVSLGRKVKVNKLEIFFFNILTFLLKKLKD